ncbi:MAG TPA: hypothetical protein HA362_02100 [Nanoarchaeota archaeon]|nr:hypothetical protein [Nanoarchaeota archaeon]
MKRLIMFYGTECSHCHAMEPLVEKLEKEKKIKVKRLEIWHNDANAALLNRLSAGKCMQIPFFFNEKTGKHICGPAAYEELKQWAAEK